MCFRARNRTGRRTAVRSQSPSGALVSPREIPAGSKENGILAEVRGIEQGGAPPLQHKKGHAMQVQQLSQRYTVRRLTPADAEAVLALAAQNEIFYRYHPPLPTVQSITADMTALPPGTTMQDKYFVGFFEDGRLVAVMDLILHYPQPGTAFVGWLITDTAGQGRGRGSALMQECEAALAAQGCRKMRLAVDKGNPQSAAFWRKNGYAFTGQEIPNEHGAYLPMEKPLV